MSSLHGIKSECFRELVTVLEVRKFWKQLQLLLSLQETPRSLHIVLFGRIRRMLAQRKQHTKNSLSLLIFLPFSSSEMGSGPVLKERELFLDSSYLCSLFQQLLLGHKSLWPCEVCISSDLTLWLPVHVCAGEYPRFESRSLLRYLLASTLFHSHTSVLY